MVAGKQYEVYVHKGKPIWKIITGILFSHAGLFCVCMGYGLLGIFSCEHLATIVFYVKSILVNQDFQTCKIDCT